MRTLILLALAGLGAQLVDGSLGMAYGVTSTTLLLAIGTNPAAASATVHLAEIGTTLASGAAHWRFGNVDWRVVIRIGIPGAVGAFAGATFLSSLSTEVAEPVMAVLLLGLGLYVLGRFTFLGLPA
ncbi:sulfite exporter TauE/SafE family protein, partial [Streptomyces sp. Ru87]